jgi:hypothetical protein
VSQSAVPILSVPFVYLSLLSVTPICKCESITTTDQLGPYLLRTEICFDAYPSSTQFSNGEVELNQEQMIFFDCLLFTEDSRSMKSIGAVTVETNNETIPLDFHTCCGSYSTSTCSSFGTIGTDRYHHLCRWEDISWYRTFMIIGGTLFLQ